MELQKAKEEAATRSQASKGKVFINLLADGSAELAKKQGEQTVHVFSNGTEIPLPAMKPEAKEKVIKTEKPKSKKMEKTAKKAAKKPAKKASAKKEKATGKGKVMIVKDLIAAMKKGRKAFTVGGTRHSLPYLESLKDKNVTREVVFKD